jgi:hypothetical protein
MQWDNNDLVRMLSHIVCLSPHEAVAASDTAYHNLYPGRWTRPGHKAFLKSDMCEQCSVVGMTSQRKKV